MAAKLKPASRKVAMAALQSRADAYAQTLLEKLRKHGMSVEAVYEIDPLITEFSKLMVAFAAHLGGGK